MEALQNMGMSIFMGELNTLRNMNSRNIVVAFECFIKKDGKYLMLHRNKDKKIMPDVWMAPGGKREFNEGLFAAARREVREETGLEIKNLKVLATGNAYLKDLKQEFYFHFVSADYSSGELILDPPDGELVWLTLEEMAKLKSILAEIHHFLPFLVSDSNEVISFTAVYEKGNELVEFEVEKP